ncbi:hypothetical protein [Phenylobacterium sp.]|uniref:hypothetical protein n=1 Tax=Phenylobacterium sp. TaxID=1871053 RepID=UPI0026245050|nr:hypothetical protein [Phenylobacterium sp.]
MTVADSALDPDALAQARRLLATPAPSERLWPVLAAAAFAAVAALALAGAMITAPPVVTQHLAVESNVSLDEAPPGETPFSEAP